MITHTLRIDTSDYPYTLKEAYINFIPIEIYCVIDIIWNPTECL
jgi:hypothetical protein